jgi:hypothetical protein
MPLLIVGWAGVGALELAKIIGSGSAVHGRFSTRQFLNSEDEGARARSKRGLFIRTANVMLSRRQPLMETSDNAATSSPAPTSTTRRSGRVTKPPAKFTPDAPAAHKRKRGAQHDDEDDENELPNDEVDDGSDVNGDDPEDSAVEEPSRATKKKKKPSALQQSAKSRRPAAKKPKTNGNAPDREPVRAAQLPSRPKKAVRVAVAQGEANGLYGGLPLLLETPWLAARFVHCIADL